MGDLRKREDDRIRRELDEELEHHIRMRTEELLAKGIAPGEARREAERRFGDLEAARDDLEATARRRRRRVPLQRTWEGALADLKLAARRARRSPGFTTVALLIFAGGVGLTTATFTLVDNVLLRALPHPDPEALVALWSVSEEGDDFPWVSMGNWVDWREGGSTLQRTALYSQFTLSVATADDAFHVAGARVAGPFFATLGNLPLAGRFFTEEEAQAQVPVAVIGEGFWRRVLDAAPLDESIDLEINGVRRQVVGVIPDRESFPGGTDVWVPFSWRAEGGGLRNNINYQVIARLADGVTIEQARAELASVAASIRERDPEAIYSWGVGVHPLRDVVVGSSRSWLVLLAIAVSFLLLVACANLAGLSLARTSRHRQETAVQLALGAGRGRMVRRAVIEHMLLALVGGGIGVALAWSATAFSPTTSRTCSHVSKRSYSTAA